MSGSLASQTVPLMGSKIKKPTAAEGTLPWRRQPHGMKYVESHPKYYWIYRNFINYSIDMSSFFK